MTPRRMYVRFAVFGVAIAVGALGVGYLYRESLRSTLRAYYLGRAIVASEEFGRDLPEVDEIEVLALGEAGTPGSPDTFYGDMGGSFGTVARQKLSGAEAERIAAIWRSLPTGHQFGALCHHPYYALRFRRNRRLILETSICWTCSNYALPLGLLGTTHFGFGAKSEQGQELFKVLSEYVPHPAKQ